MQPLANYFGLLKIVIDNMGAWKILIWLVLLCHYVFIFASAWSNRDYAQ
jgi:hypothetical protein